MGEQTMKRRTLLAGAAALAAAPAIGRAAEKTKIVWWHAMTAALGDEVNRLVAAFNKSQDEVEVQAIYKGGYADVLTATIAAFRAGQAPHLAQIFEVGTGSMLAAGKAVKQVWELAKDTGVAIDPEAYIPAVRGYYSLADGRMASMPFNSSTAVMWYSKDAFRKAGLDPDKPPATWQDVATAADAIKAKDAARSADDHVVADLDPARTIQRPAQHPVRQQVGRVRRAWTRSWKSTASHM